MKIKGYLKRKIMVFKLLKKIEQLNIENAGVDDEKIPYIKLKNDFIFYGKSTPKNKRKYYYFLSKKLRSIIPVECFSIAKDIIIRYQESGLMWGGPKKETFYQVKKDDVVSEMGAYMGYYSMKLSKKVGNLGKVVAIEPIMDNLKILKKNATENKLSNICIVEKGVWNSPTKLDFYKKENDNQSSSIDKKLKGNERYLIDVDSLDNIYSENNIKNLDFIVIQLNGAEYEALKGLKKYYPQNIAIAARYEGLQKNIVNKICQLQESRGYVCKVLKDDFIFCSLKENK